MGRTRLRELDRAGDVRGAGPAGVVGECAGGFAFLQVQRFLDPNPLAAAVQAAALAGVGACVAARHERVVWILGRAAIGYLVPADVRARHLDASGLAEVRRACGSLAFFGSCVAVELARCLAAPAGAWAFGTPAALAFFAGVIATPLLIAAHGAAASAPRAPEPSTSAARRGGTSPAGRTQAFGPSTSGHRPSIAPRSRDS